MMNCHHLQMVLFQSLSLKKKKDLEARRKLPKDEFGRTKGEKNKRKINISD